ncbi:TadE/TadG family type IV pilus assembly protein [Sphingomonas endolithica]|uniref:TadE/TadG family type IV pilus assembly protein n=1 Tax=Sphingomonas endolithica TaxID=2972485 RepID=UPI0021AEBDF4|nr:TadE family protein [Sphingomonas sp. ZFBP2030]
MSLRFIMLRSLAAEKSGIALIEFAFAAPLLMVLGMYGLETANLAIMRMRVSQAAANLADNISRMGAMDTLGVKSIREVDINDSFAALRSQSSSYKLTTYGRVILSSLERNSAGGQWIHWQRCLGKKQWASSYGVAGNGSSGTGFAGMGPTGQPKITAPDKSGVMFVEIAFDYQPLFSNSLLGEQTIQTKSAFIVRDQRDFTDAKNPYNPSPSATAASCTLYEE